MKWLLGSLILLASCATCVAQTTTYSSTTVILHYPQPVVSRGIANGPAQSFTPSGVTTPMNGYSRPTPVNELTAMNMSFIVKARSLSPTSYAYFSKAANDMRKSPDRSAMLRRLIYELPSRMEDTRYIPPSPESILAALDRVESATDAEVAAYWRNR